MQYTCTRHAYLHAALSLSNATSCTAVALQLPIVRFQSCVRPRLRPRPRSCSFSASGCSSLVPASFLSSLSHARRSVISFTYRSSAAWHPGTPPAHDDGRTPPSMLSALSPGPAPRPPAPTHPRLRPCRSLGHSSSSSSRPVPVRSRVLPRVLLEREHISAQLPELHRSADDQSRRFPGAEGLEKFAKCRIP